MTSKSEGQWLRSENSTSVFFFLPTHLTGLLGRYTWRWKESHERYLEFTRGMVSRKHKQGSKRSKLMFPRKAVAPQSTDLEKPIPVQRRSQNCWTSMYGIVLSCAQTYADHVHVCLSTHEQMAKEWLVSFPFCIRIFWDRILASESWRIHDLFQQISISRAAFGLRETEGIRIPGTCLPQW